ncbi:redoxin domain-containing protein [Zafaria sp. J156]|uniref:redoxin domain-containing protein n=1 Tax=Zafaria sp. J156 TaxID=3116490 RepID=UPI002E7A47DB|nr:redoxin domain-containing protein [Zafaria sp. J156]MEE1620672.1 redoxin domain-containing protein [Zafaria sp. J156]
MPALAGPGVGSAVPRFSLVDQFGAPVDSGRFADEDAFLVFYPFAFSRVCTSELGALEALRPELEEQGIGVYGVSVDHKYALRAYAAEEGLGFGLLSDFWPHGAAATAFGCFDPEHGRALRETFLLSGGRIADRFGSAPDAQRPVERYRSAARALRRA